MGEEVGEREEGGGGEGGVKAAKRVNKRVCRQPVVNLMSERRPEIFHRPPPTCSSSAEPMKKEKKKKKKKKKK